MTARPVDKLKKAQQNYTVKRKPIIIYKDHARRVWMQYGRVELNIRLFSHKKCSDGDVKLKLGHEGRSREHGGGRWKMGMETPIGKRKVIVK